MRKQVTGRSRATLSPIMDESYEPEPKPWAITQQHGKTMNKSHGRLESRVKQEAKLRQGEAKGKKSGESNKITLPVLGWLFFIMMGYFYYLTAGAIIHYTYD